MEPLVLLANFERERRLSSAGHIVVARQSCTSGFFTLPMTATIIYVDVLDADKLLPAVTQASENLNLSRISPQQTSRRRSERRNSPLRSKSVQLGENRPCGCIIWTASAPSI
jgi:hypothetical protein